ncbi:ankyrin repeat domain-containing protein [Legionella sainthelensi]|uniref:ankyrin repeat domain-containing protein n=1 Tax=Legionella sainthelensi TaxID=28087 RepID=UPI000E1FCE11|nr:ankyrin repeat domain-containing protein [Legionella sainthelensi]
MNSSSLLKLLNEVDSSYNVLEKLKEAHFAVTDRTDEGDSVLHILAKSKHAQTRYFFDYLQNLVNAGADAVAIDNQNNVFLSYYLEQGERYNDNETFRLLLKNKDFDINQIITSDKTFFEFIYDSRDWNVRDSMEMFIKHKKFNPNLKTSKHNSILLHMISENVFAHKEHLLKVANHPQTNPNIKNNNGQTTLDLILSDTSYKNMELVTALINHEQCDINHLDKDGNNYLQLAIISCEFQAGEIAQLLINKAIDVDHKNNQGKSVFDLIVENRAGRSDYASNALLIQILKLHPASLLEKYKDGKSILSEILKSEDYTLQSKLSSLLSLCKDQRNGGEIVKKTVAEFFNDFRQGLVSEEAIIALTSGLIDAQVDIDVEYCFAQCAIYNFSGYTNTVLNSNFKMLKPQLDLKAVIHHLKNLTPDNSEERLRALTYLNEFGFSLDNLDEGTLALEDECHAKSRQDIEKASKMFGHLFSLSGSIPKEDRLIKLTGSSPRDTAPFMIYLMNAYIAHCQTHNKNKEYLDTIREVRNMAVKAMRFYSISHSYYQSTNTANEKMLRSMIEDSKNSGVEIITGWPEHTIDLVIKQNDLYRNNGGGCSTDATIEHYKISKPENITKDMFSTLCNDELESNKAFIQRDLHSLLGLVFIDSIPGDFQTVGNCSLYSLLIALKTKYQLFLPENIAEQLLTDTVKFFEQFYLEEYLALHANNPTAPHLIMRLIIQKLMPEGQLELIRRLLKEHFNTEANKEIMQTALMLKRWKLSASGKSTEQFDKQLQTLGVCLEPTNERLEILQRFLNDEVTTHDLDELKSWPLSKQTLQGYHLLHFAVMNNNVALASSLVQMFPNAVNQTNWYGEEPLCLVNSVEMIEVLINAGANATRTDSDHALDYAIRANRVDLVRSLLKHGAKPSEYSAYYAASKDPKILQSLMEHYPETVTKPTHDYSTSIHAAARAGNDENIRTLVYYGGANPDTSNVNGITPLQLALKNGHKNTAKLLIEYPGTLFKDPHRGESIIKMTQDEEIQKSIELKGQERKEDLEYFQTTFKNSNPGIINENIDYLIVAIRINDVRAIRGCLLAYPNLKVVDTSDHYCTTPIGEAIHRLAGTKGDEYKQAFNIIEMLLKTPAIDINAIQASSEPILFWATSIGDVAVLDLFLADHKLDPNQQDNVGYTALHDAVERGHLDCVKRLLADERVDSTIVNHRNQTAAELDSFRYNSIQCIDEVVKHQQCLKENYMSRVKEYC